MKYGILSDLHLEHYDDHAFGRLWAMARRADVDVILLGGDIHPNPWKREAFISMIEDMDNEIGTKRPVRFVMGNHDWWGGEFWEQGFQRHDGVISTPLYTNFGDNPLIMNDAFARINDFKFINGLKPDDYIEAYDRAVDAIFASEEEVVLTHWAPTLQAVSHKFKGMELNPYFCNDLDEKIRTSNKKLWVFGHVHDKYDFMIGDCRMVSNPMGYPHENDGKYEVKIIEL